MTMARVMMTMTTTPLAYVPTYLDIGGGGGVVGEEWGESLGGGPWTFHPGRGGRLAIPCLPSLRPDE
jgi:hypothetical protein